MDFEFVKGTKVLFGGFNANKYFSKIDLLGDGDNEIWYGKFPYFLGKLPDYSNLEPLQKRFDYTDSLIKNCLADFERKEYPPVADNGKKGFIKKVTYVLKGKNEHDVHPQHARSGRKATIELLLEPTAKNEFRFRLMVY